MAGRSMIIEELVTLGQSGPTLVQRFEWNAAHRNIPLRPWSFPVHQRTVRTDYPGADDPTEQVLGPNFAPFTLRGRWDDRYNPQAVEDPRASGSLNRGFVGGYAVREWRAFEAMVRRGNLVRITFEEVTIQGIVTDAVFDYRRSWDIGYSFTMSPHHRQPGGFFALRRSPRTVLNASQFRSEVALDVDAALLLHERAPQVRLVGDVHSDAQDALDSWSDLLAQIDDAIEQRNLTPELEPGTALLRLASLFFSLTTVGQTLLTLLQPLDSSEALSFEAGVEALDYDVWSRGLMFRARRVIVGGQRASADLRQRAEPNARALYKPQAGESLYEVSNRFYSTPHNWRRIATRNGLADFVLTGEELLIIPEVTGR